MDTTKDTPASEVIDKEDELLKEAIEAAKAGDVERMSACLMSSRFPDGLIRRVEQMWHKLSHEDARDIVAESIEALYGKVRCEELITDIKAWLSKATRLRASTANRRRIRRSEVSLDAPEYGDYQLAVEPRYDQHVIRQEAVRQLKTAVSQIQGYNIRRVLEYLFEAVEGGMFPVPAIEIAEALELEEANVRQCVRRGFKRLQDVLKAEGWSDENFGVFGSDAGTSLGWTYSSGGDTMDEGGNGCG